MNLLIIKSGELTNGTALLSGARARYVYDFHDLKPGANVAAGILGGCRGRARVVKIAPAEIVLEFSAEGAAAVPPRSAISAAVAVSRPQTTKKVIQFAAMFGFRELLLFRSANVDQNYLRSKCLRPEAIEAESIRGLEQGVDTIAPQVELCDDFDMLTSKVLDRSAAEWRVAADPKLGRAPAEIKAKHTGDNRTIFLCIGPERGFLPIELERLAALSFDFASLGPRILRVEFALSYLAGIFNN